MNEEKMNILAEMKEYEKESKVLHKKRLKAMADYRELSNFVKKAVIAGEGK